VSRTRRTQQSGCFVRIVGPLAVGLALVAAWVPIDPALVERWYSTTLYRSFQPHLTLLSSLVPFALLDVGVGLIVLALAWAFARDWRSAGVLRALAGTLWRTAITVAIVYLLFLVTWGLNYRRVPLEQKLDFDRARITHDAALALATRAVEEVNAGHAAAHAGTFNAEALEYAFIDAVRLVGTPSPPMTARPKRSLAGFYFRYAAIDGMTVPVFLEIILNPDLLAVERPSVLAHEWAHLAGYADESEASFIAWIAGTRGSDPVARYSAWLDTYGLAYSALPRALRAKVPPLDEGPRSDLAAIRARYARSSPAVRRVARDAYDSYLRANRIEEGIDNYAVALQLMLGSRLPASGARLPDPGLPAEAPQARRWAHFLLSR
jgi:hypothetical protein